MTTPTYSVRCIDCGSTMPGDYVKPLCDRCGGILEIGVDYEQAGSTVREEGWGEGRISVWRYRKLLPVGGVPVTLGEGGTPLLRAERAGEWVGGLKNLYVKYEGANPTGSFKDRGMTVGVTRAVELGQKAVACASTGNTSASLAAYAARAGLPAFVLVPEGAVARGKLAQASAHGAYIVGVEGNFDKALSMILQGAEELGLYVLNSVNPFRIEGQKTVSFEVFDQLGAVPKNMVFPVGNAGNISASWKGFRELREIGLSDEAPRMMGVQARGASPIAEAFARGSWGIRPVESPETVATAIRIGRPVSWRKALRALYDSKGSAVAVGDGEILEAQSALARLEGVFTEPAGAASLAGLRELVAQGAIGGDEVTVCVATGHGLKDPDTPIVGWGTVKHASSLEEVKALLGKPKP